MGATGASGLPLTVAVLKIIQQAEGFESVLIVSRSAEVTLRHETGLGVDDLRSLADINFDPTEIGAGPASGSYKTEGMVVVPCSMKTLAGIHSGFSGSLLLRAADVTMKEQRPLILCTRESPLSAIHLRNMQELSLVPGVRIVPPMMTFYGNCSSVEEMTYGVAARLLMPFGIEAPGYKRWNGLENE